MINKLISKVKRIASFKAGKYLNKLIKWLDKQGFLEAANHIRTNEIVYQNIMIDTYLFFKKLKKHIGEIKW